MSDKCDKPYNSQPEVNFEAGEGFFDAIFNRGLRQDVLNHNVKVFIAECKAARRSDMMPVAYARLGAAYNTADDVYNT